MFHQKTVLNCSWKIGVIQSNHQISKRCRFGKHHLVQDSSSIICADKFNLNPRLIGKLSDEFIGKTSNIIRQNLQCTIAFSNLNF